MVARSAPREQGLLFFKELGMPDLRPDKTGETGARDRRRRFLRGRSGNPAGRPRGRRDHSNRAARLLLAGEGEALTRKAIELAFDNDPAVSRRHPWPLSRARRRIRDAADPQRQRSRRIG
jgi:hypothetical protein